MKRRILSAILGIGLLTYFSYGRVVEKGEYVEAQETGTPAQSSPENLLVVWTSADPEVATNMVFMYTLNAKTRGWWEDGTIRLLIWGPSQKLLLANAELQESLKQIMESGVEVLACRGCAEGYGIVSELQELGIDVHYTGTDLTTMLKDRWAVITF